MERLFPDRIEQEREKNRTENELLKPIKKIGRIGGVSANKPRCIVIVNRTLPAVYKPQVEEYTLRNGITRGTHCLREWLAYQIDRAINTNIVPVTVLRDGPNGLGSVQECKIGAVAMNVDWKNKASSDSILRIALFDAIIKNSDRNRGNFLIAADGSAPAIDNALILSKCNDFYDRTRSFPLSVVEGKEIPEELRENIATFLKSSEIQSILYEAFKLTVGNAEEAIFIWDEFIDRLHSLQENGTMPKNDWL